MIEDSQAEQIKDIFGRLPIDMIMVYQMHFCPPPIAYKTAEVRVVSSDGHSTMVWGWDAESILEELNRYLKVSAFF